MRRAQKQFYISVNLYQLLTGCPTETLRLILGCLAAKWAVSDARNALIWCPGYVPETECSWMAEAVTSFNYFCDVAY